MNSKQLIDNTFRDIQFPAGRLSKDGLAKFECFARLIEEQQNFDSPLINLACVTVLARPATGEKPAMPARKFARMAIRRKPQATPANPQP